MALKMAIKRFLVCYEGRVQGVGFRYNAIRQSVGLRVHGFIRNQPDGSVLMDVEGSGVDLKQLLERIEAEMNGNIEAVEVIERPLAGHVGDLKIQH
ncbi:MAG: acylphosphatase [Rubripirellula sp.]|nr:acylphosphatase [Rubripirellula sp.]